MKKIISNITAITCILYSTLSFSEGLTIDIKKKEETIQLSVQGNNEQVLNAIVENFSKVKKMEVIKTSKENSDAYVHIGKDSYLDIDGKRVTFNGKNELDIANSFSDYLYSKFLKKQSFFNEKIVFVQKKNDKYILSISNFDGKNKKDLLVSPKPILSPDLSTNQNMITYVSFEDIRPSVFIYNLNSKKITKVSNFKGVHSDPKFSQDDSKIMMSLSKDGDADLYIYEINSNTLTKITNNKGNEINPSWISEQLFLFSSDKTGNPNVYIYKNGTTDKVFNTEKFTLSPQYNEDNIFAVYFNSGFYGIIRKDNKTQIEEVIVRDFYIESPSLSKNGELIVYATKENNRSIIKFVDTEGNLIYSLRYQNSDIIEPSF